MCVSVVEVFLIVDRFIVCLHATTTMSLSFYSLFYSLCCTDRTYSDSTRDSSPKNTCSRSGARYYLLCAGVCVCIFTNVCLRIAVCVLTNSQSLGRVRVYEYEPKSLCNNCARACLMMSPLGE